MTTWREPSRHRPIDRYGLIRGAFAVLLLLVVLAVLAVPAYVAIQVALALIGWAP